MYQTYIQEITQNKVACGKLERLAVERYLHDRNNPTYEFRENEVKRAIAFIESFHHYTGKHNNQKFRLSGWQSFIVANIVGFYHVGTNRRKYTRSYIEISRKAGKTMFAVALSLYFLFADKEGGAEVLFAANSKEQARIAFDMATTLTKQKDEKQRFSKCQHSKIMFPSANAVLKVLAADDSTLDGFNCSFGLVDEFHASKTSRVYDVIRSSQGMREKPHLMCITTAGFNKTSPCYELRTSCVDVLTKIAQDESTFALIFSIDDGDDWRDEKVWRKVNPNMGITVNEAFLREQVIQASVNPADEVGIKTKNFNIWCDSAEVWIPTEKIIDNMREIEWSELYNGEPTFIGVDLSSVSDLTAVSYLQYNEADGTYIIKTSYYLPEETLHKGLDAIKYSLWRNSGHVTITPGNVTDYDYITRDIVKHVDSGMYVSNIAYDQWNSTQWVISCVERDMPMNPFSQSIGNFNRATKEMERLVLQNKIAIDSSPISRFCFENVVLKEDANGNAKPIKNVRSRKIDGVISMLMSLGGWLDIYRPFQPIV